MAHAKPDDLKDLSSLLSNIRSMQTLKEKSMGCFYFKSKGVLHFHLQNGRRFAHVFDGSRWQEVDLPDNPSTAQQTKYFKTITVLLPLSTGKGAAK
jgi:hypothetical protein